MFTQITGLLPAKPSVLLLIDKWNWAFHTIAMAVEKHLSDEFRFTILSAEDDLHINESDFDIIHVLFESEYRHRTFLTGKAKIVKSVYSHYWELEGMNAEQFYNRHLSEAHAVTVPSLRLLRQLQNIPAPVYLFAEGVDTDVFRPVRGVKREETVGWAGDPERPVKRLNWLREAAQDVYPLRIAAGQTPIAEMASFYSRCAIVACSSQAEGCPRPILEGMACGAFPVSFDVGVVPEVIRHKVNGYIVEQHSVSALREALRWCKEHPDILETARGINIELIRGLRTWKATTPHLADIYHSVLS